MADDDQFFWINTQNYADCAIHNRLTPTDYHALAVTWSLKLLPNTVGGTETEVGSGTCSYVGTDTDDDGNTRYIFRATFFSADLSTPLVEKREYALDFSASSIKFGDRLKKATRYYGAG